MEKHVGKRSSKDCTEAELEQLVYQLRKLGALDDGRPFGKADRGGKSGNRPTRAQWLKAKLLCTERGWLGGIDDPSFATFVEHVAKVSNPRFLTASSMRDVIVGLERWIEHDRMKGREA